MLPPELTLTCNPSDDSACRTPKVLRKDALDAAKELISMAEEWAVRPEVSFKTFESELRPVLFALARAAITLFLARREEWLMKTQPAPVEVGDRQFRLAPAIARNLATLFGVVRYKRTYMREVADGPRRGFFPLDVDLGLTSDRISFNVLSRATLLATKLSFAEARSTLQMFVPNTPSTEVIEQAVLGLGRHTADWFTSQPPPEDDGDVLIIMFDGKGAPMATETELDRRRGKRKKRRKAPSPRHRGRLGRKRHPKKPRRKKGDKSKNAKMATMVVMYTLKRSGKKLLGPLNRRVYASFAAKRHAFEFARREADKRGFPEDSGKLVQLVTDGDQDLATYGSEYFPSATHTIDIIHVIEKLWQAGECLFREGSSELQAWIDQQKDRLYRGEIDDILDELWCRLEATPKTGPGNKGRRKRLDAVGQYIANRGAERMNYDELLAQDLEISTGMIEGAIKNVIGRRFDFGGSRWIKERAEALLQLRCIEVNGDWEAFMSYVHDRLRAETKDTVIHLRVQSRTPADLPVVKKAA